jgi:hypothetical protein
MTTAFLSRIPPPANDVGQQRAGEGADETFRGAIAVAARRDDVLVLSSFSVVPLHSLVVIIVHS